MQYLGLLNVVMYRHEPKECKFLIFYDYDSHNESMAYQIKECYDRFATSYVMYKTKNGYHAIGLTPLTAMQWGSYFNSLHNRFKEFYGGQVIRITPKKDETRELFAYSFNQPYIEALGHYYAKLLGIPKGHLPKYGSPPDYGINMQKYWSLND